MTKVYCAEIKAMNCAESDRYNETHFQAYSLDKEKLAGILKSEMQKVSNFWESAGTVTTATLAITVWVREAGDYNYTARLKEIELI